MIGRREPPHAEIEFRGERQGEEGFAKAQLFRSRERQQPQQRESAIDRHQCHGQGREEFQHGAGYEGDLEDLHGASRDFAGCPADLAGYAILRAEGKDRGQRRHPVDEKAGQARESQELPVCLGLAGKAGQRHARTEGNQRGQQDQGAKPAGESDSHRDDQRGKHGRQPQRLKAGDQSLVRLHIIDRHAQIFADQAPA